MQALGQTVFTATALPLSTSRCTGRSRGNVCIRAVAAPAKLDTRKSEQVCAFCPHHSCPQKPSEPVLPHNCWQHLSSAPRKCMLRSWWRHMHAWWDMLTHQLAASSSALQCKWQSARPASCMQANLCKSGCRRASNVALQQYAGVQRGPGPHARRCELASARLPVRGRLSHHLRERQGEHGVVSPAATRLQRRQSFHARA